MTTLSLSIDPRDESSIAGAIGVLQRLLGNGVAPPAAASSTATARTGAARGQTGGASAQGAASAGTARQGSTAATGDAGNATGAGSAGPASQAASAAAKPSGGANAAADQPPSFDDVKKLFLALSQKKGRPACEGVLAQFGIAKLSEAKPEQYAGLKAAIDQASA